MVIDIGTIMPFGKYRGVVAGKMDTSYIQWLHNETTHKLTPRLRDMISGEGGVVWTKSVQYSITSTMQDIGGFMTALGNIHLKGVVNDVLHIEVLNHKPEFNMERVQKVLKAMTHRVIPTENINIVYQEK